MQDKLTSEIAYGGRGGAKSWGIARALPPAFIPSAVAFRLTCNGGPRIPDKPHTMITKQPSQFEAARAEIIKSEALAKLAELRRSFSEKAKN